MSSQPKHCRMDWTGLGWRSWGAELGRSKASRVKPEEVKSNLLCLNYPGVDECTVCKACVRNSFSFPCSLNLYTLKSCWASFYWLNQFSPPCCHPTFKLSPLIQNDYIISYFWLSIIHIGWTVHNSFLLSPTQSSCSPFFPSLSVSFLPVGVADLQQHLPAVLEGSERGVGCGERGRSVPRVLPRPLGGALSPYWGQAPRPRRVLTGHRADGPVWKDTGTHTHRKHINKSVWNSKHSTLSCVQPPPPPQLRPLFSQILLLCSLFLSFTPSSCVFPLLFSPGGLLGAAVRCSVEQSWVEVEVGKERGGYHRHREEPNADPLYTDYTLALLAHPWPWPQPLQQPHSGWH